eukprot:6177909-Pleurochrysis_carterae.AAC.3
MMRRWLRRCGLHSRRARAIVPKYLLPCRRSGPSGLTRRARTARNKRFLRRICSEARSSTLFHSGVDFGN